MTNHSTRPTRFGWPIVIAVILVMIVISLIIPEVRASVSAWLGLSVAPSNQMPAVQVTLVAITPSTPVGAAPLAVALPTLRQTNAAPTEVTSPTALQTLVSSGTPLDFSQLATQIGWDILTPNFLPDGYHFQSAYDDTNQNMLVLTYLVTRLLPGATDPSLTSSETITLLQSQKNDFIPMQIAPNTNVTDIQVNGRPAAYTVGGWDTEFVKDNTAPNGGKMVSSWRTDLPVKNLYWQIGKIYFALITADEAVSQQELIDMASSIGR